MIALFTNEDGRVQLMHYQPDLLTPERRAQAALEVETLPPEPPTDDEDLAAVLFVVDGELVYTIEARRLGEEQRVNRSMKLAARTSIVDKVIADALDDATISKLVDLFPPWKVGIDVEPPEVYAWNGTLVECIQPHTTQADWSPDVAESLWKIHRTAEPQAWVQPTGEHDAYKMGDLALHNGKTWQVTGVDANGNNVWEPGVYGWTEVV